MDINKERESFEKHASKFFKTNEAFENDGENYVYDEVKFMWDCWLAAKAHEAEKLKGCVLVPVQCPDPDFADSLFDELSKKAIGEFGDDLLIHFSNIDEEKIWALMVEAAKAQAVPKWISVKDNLPPANMLVLGMSQTRSNIFNVYNVMALDEFEEAEVTHWMPLPDAPQEQTND